MRSVWQNSVTFGFVHIPVAGSPATAEEKVRFPAVPQKEALPICG
jgi:non-homologous end joining protein Ku